MTPNEAYTKAKNETGTEFTSCFEMDKYYLFGTEELINLFSVNKDNGDVRVFNPIYDCTSMEFAKKTTIKDFR